MTTNRGGQKTVHFIGIGGIGISAIARMFFIEGKRISGSDQSESAITRDLATLGAKIHIGHKAENLPSDVDLVVHTIAIDEHNPELRVARERGVELVTYPEMLGRISARKYTIAVAGTHGKTTTTAMIAKIFADASAVQKEEFKKIALEPTVIVGSLINGLKTNFLAGRGPCLIVEACEYRRSFLNLSPKVLVITNIDIDHLDYYQDLADIQRAFMEMVEKVPPEGFLVCDQSDPKLEPIVSAAKCRVVDYRKITSEFKLLIPGIHNIRNAQAALAVAETQGINFSIAVRALQDFRGTWRRFEYKGQTESGAKVYDDYAHHPTEIRATLNSAREISQGKIFVVFQPHLYSRTRMLFDDFATCFEGATEVVLLPIYAAREAFDPSVDSQGLARAIADKGMPARSVSDFNEAVEYLKDLAGPNDLILTVGAGNITDLATLFVNS